MLKKMIVSAVLAAIGFVALGSESHASVRLTPTNMVVTGSTPTFTTTLSTGTTYLIRNDGKTFIHMKKTGLDACTVTFTTPGTVSGLAIADPTATVGATTGDVLMGPFPPSIYNDGNGDLNLTFSDEKGLSIVVYKL